MRLKQPLATGGQKCLEENNLLTFFAQGHQREREMFQQRLKFKPRVCCYLTLFKSVVGLGSSSWSHDNLMSETFASLCELGAHIIDEICQNYIFHGN